MDIVKIQTLIAQGRVVELTDIDPTQSFVQIGIYQPDNRKIGSGNNTYPPFVIPVSELVPQNIYTPYILYVDDTAGDDATGEKGYPSKPYASIEAATTAAVSGDIIMVERGYYSVTGIKPNVTYYLGVSTIYANGFIDASYGPGSFNVYGHATIESSQSLIYDISGSTVHIECNYIGYFANCVGGTISNSEINITTNLFQGLNNSAFGVYLEGASINVLINITSDRYLLPRGFISWFNGTNPITINLYGREMIHSGPDSFASLSWILGNGMTQNFFVQDIIINAVGANAFFPWYGVLNVYSKIQCNTDTSWIMADGGVSTFYADITAPLGLLYVRGAAATVILRQANLLSGRQGDTALVNGNLFLYESTIKSTDVLSANPVIGLTNVASNLMLNNSKIISISPKFSIQDTIGSPNLVQVYGSCYSVTAPVNITEAPGTITQYALLQ
jgi:hypothetical protein